MVNDDDESDVITFITHLPSIIHSCNKGQFYDDLQQQHNARDYSTTIY